VEFRILGPLEMAVGSERLELGSSRQQAVIAALLLSPNMAISVDRLAEAMYGEDLPRTPRAQVQIGISSLRRLFTVNGHPEIISTQANGYLIRVGDGELDAERFGQLVSAARAAREAGRLDQAVAGYRDALRLWRGPALDGIDSPLLAAASALDEQRITVNEDCLELELELGRHHELAGELAGLARAFPLRERLRCQQMLALYRCGRVAEALEVYRDTRRILVDELGIEPGERLRQLERAILNADPALDLTAEPARIQPPRWRAPGMLPADIADFTGRTEELAVVGQRLSRASGSVDQYAVPVVVIVGRGGIGKTSLAVRAAHGVAAHFSEGQLFAALHGGGPHPVDPARVLERFLRVLGVPGSQLPEGLDERAEVYRNLLADRKVLVVLDDAASEAQVSPLLPGTGLAGVIITSRSRLTGLPGAVRVEVPTFNLSKSVDLLSRIAGPARVAREPDAAAEVAGRCGHLPLALRIAGARLAARPHWSVQRMADRLTDETRRLDELRHGDLGIRPSISLSYEGISERARRLFRRLALVEAPDFSCWLSSVLIDERAEHAEDLLDDLISAHLVEISGGSDVHSRYRFHDLIRGFARERLAEEETAAERMEAVERVLGALQYVADAAHRGYYGGDYVRIRSDVPRWPLPERLVQQLVADPLAWYERERATLVWGVRQAAQAGLAERCWSLASSTLALFDTRRYLDDWRETHQIALEAARKADDLRGEAAMLYSFGAMHVMQGRFAPAREELTAAAQLFQDAGSGQGVAYVTRYIAELDRFSGRLDDAAEGYARALTVLRDSDDNIAVAIVLRDLAETQLEFQRCGEARGLLSEALRLTRAAGCAKIEGQVLNRLGEAWMLSEEPSSALAAFGQALSIARDIGDVLVEAYALRGTGVARVRLGEFGPAREALQHALELAGRMDTRVAQARVLLGLSELALASDDPGEAIVSGQRAAAAFREMRMPLYEARALTLLSDAYAALGEAGSADATSANAAALRASVLAPPSPAP
jgi:DNA-binding SARP family transcriptional activator